MGAEGARSRSPPRFRSPPPPGRLKSLAPGRKGPARPRPPPRARTRVAARSARVFPNARRVRRHHRLERIVVRANLRREILRELTFRRVFRVSVAGGGARRRYVRVYASEDANASSPSDDPSRPFFGRARTERWFRRRRARRGSASLRFFGRSAKGPPTTFGDIVVESPPRPPPVRSIRNSRELTRRSVHCGVLSSMDEDEREVVRVGVRVPVRAPVRVRVLVALDEGRLRSTASGNSNASVTFRLVMV